MCKLVRDIRGKVVLCQSVQDLSLHNFFSVCFLDTHSHTGICTLPPITEDLSSRPNQLVREANAAIEKVVKENDKEDKCSVIQVYSRFEAILEKKARKSSLVSLGLFFPISTIQVFVYHFPFLGFLFTWNILSAFVGQTLLCDGVHLNEKGRDELVDAVIEWLNKKHVAKAIAVKKS